MWIDRFRQGLGKKEFRMNNVVPVRQINTDNTEQSSSVYGEKHDVKMITEVILEDHDRVGTAQHFRCHWSRLRIRTDIGEGGNPCTYIHIGEVHETKATALGDKNHF